MANEKKIGHFKKKLGHRCENVTPIRKWDRDKKKSGTYRLEYDSLNLNGPRTNNQYGEYPPIRITWDNKGVLLLLRKKDLEPINY